VESITDAAKGANTAAMATRAVIAASAREASDESLGTPYSSKEDPMTRVYAGITAALALGLTACGDSRPEPTAPEASVEAAFSANGSSDEDNDFSERRDIAIRDDCDPRDPGWAPTGGCLLRRGDVTFAEFNAEMNSPLAASVVGHQAWRNDPSYIEIQPGKTVRVSNTGGRAHTFTEVAMFGGGKVPSPALNKGLVTAPECPGSTDIPPGATVQVAGLGVGNHRFQCCIHPWMRALIKVKATQAEH
jgi:plastocyanin